MNSQRFGCVSFDIGPGSSEETVEITAKFGEGENAETIAFEMPEEQIDTLREEKPPDVPMNEALRRTFIAGLEAAERGDPEIIEKLEEPSESGVE